MRGVSARHAAAAIRGECMDARVLGVVGGMGGLASAAFVGSVYRCHANRAEQTQPIVWLRSNPRLPDRTAALLGPASAEGAASLAAGIAAELEALQAAGAHRLLVCCVTAHAVLAELPAALQKPLISLLDVLFTAPALPQRRRLVLCTEATRQLRLLENHPGFAAHAAHLVFPDAEAQARVHRIIYDLKGGALPAAAVPVLVELARRHGADGLVAGCTEMHLLPDLPEGLDCVDPLVEVANRLEVLLG